MYNSRVFGLDILRATAILLVLLAHGVYFFTNSWDIFYLLKFFPDGVSMFFVLSGFLIGNILIHALQKRNLSLNDLKNFWIRRWFRTLPAYYFILCLLVVSSWFRNTNHSSLEYLKYFFFLQAFDSGNCYLYMESWSLCVEEFFYLLISFLLFFLIKFTNLGTKKILAFFIVLVIIAGTAFTIYKIKNNQYITNMDWDIFIRKTVFTRLNSIMYGFLGAYIMFYHFSVWKYKNIYFIMGLSLFIFLSIRPIFGISPFFNYEQLSLESIATLLLIPYLSCVRTGKGYIFRVLTFISSISYSIYLINYTPFYILETEIKAYFNIYAAHQGFIRLGLFLTWSFGAGYLMYRFVEKPMLKKRDSLSHKEYRNLAPIRNT